MNTTISELLQALKARSIRINLPIRWRTQLVARFGERRSNMSNTRGSEEFVGRRPQGAGDSAESIDFVASAQRSDGKLVVRQVMEPRAIPIVVLVNFASSMNFGTVRTIKKVMAMELALSVLSSAAKSGDRVGFTAFAGDRVELCLLPRDARSVTLQAVSYLKESLLPGAERSAGGRSLTSAGRSAAGGGRSPASAGRSAASATTGNATSGFAQALLTLPRARSLVFVISDFFALTGADRAALQRAASLHDIICLAVHDPREKELPRAWLPFPYVLKDMETGKSKWIWLTWRKRRRYAQDYARHVQEITKLVQSQGGDFAVFSTAQTLDETHRLLYQVLGGH